jgi:hypothetical protein
MSGFNRTNQFSRADTHAHLSDPVNGYSLGISCGVPEDFDGLF